LISDLTVSVENAVGGGRQAQYLPQGKLVTEDQFFIRSVQSTKHFIFGADY